MNFIFEPHGSFSVRIEGRMVVSEVEGPWNLELVKAWAESVGPLYAQLGQSGPCGGIGVHTKSMLTSLESIDQLRRMTQCARSHYNFVAAGIVGDSSVEGRRLASTFMAPIYSGIVPFQVFDSFVDARSWVHANIHAAVHAGG